jgi:aminopeptidase-like protein
MNGMVRHVVMFKLMEFASPADKTAKLQEIKINLEALKDKIDFVRMICVDFNINSAETWDFILTTEFDSLEDVERYATHPDHVAVSKNIISPVKTDRACVDYMY